METTMSDLIPYQSNQTMSSTEISQLTKKKKSDIHQDIKIQLLDKLYGVKDDGKNHHKEIQGITIKLDNRGYWSDVRLDRYHTDILISGYEVKYRAAIIKRWYELEHSQLDVKPEPLKLNNAKAAQTLSSIAGSMAKTFGYKGTQALLVADKATKRILGVSPLEVMDEQLISDVQDALLTPTELGQLIGKKKLEVNPYLESHGLQTHRRSKSGSIIWELTDLGMEHGGVYLDVGKAHTDGVPVQQIKWAKTKILAFLETVKDEATSNVIHAEFKQESLDLGE
jgi:phage regulator Rha-like protein